MKKIKSTDILAILLAIATYMMVGPYLAYFSNGIFEIFNRLNNGEFSILSLLGLLPLVAVYFSYKYLYNKQMEVLSSDRFKKYVEMSRRDMLDKGFLFESKESVEKKYYPDTESFAMGLIPVAIIIIIISIFWNYWIESIYPLLDFKDFGTLSFYAGLIIVIVNFIPKPQDTAS